MWTPKLADRAMPLYLAIADAAAADIGAGVLRPGEQLPPHRALAKALDIDFTTVTRAYAEVRRRGLVEGRVGQGTFVLSPRETAAQPRSNGLVDLGMNLPPAIDDKSIVARMWASFDAVSGDGSKLLMRYQEPGGSLRDRAAGLSWLKGRVDLSDTSRLLVAPGAQGALTAIMATLARPGDVVLVEDLSYPGFITLASHLGITLVAVASDALGILPEALDKACAEHGPKALYCTPTLHNPTTRTWDAGRRRDVVAIARARGLPIIEDDAYGLLPQKPVDTLASLAPDLVYYVASLSKCLAPALRIAYLVAPSEPVAMRLAGALRAMTAMASPLTAAVATSWVEGQLAHQILAAIRDESRARQAMLADIVPGRNLTTDRDGFHAWLTLPSQWSRGEFVARLRALGVAAVASDAFAVAAPPEAVRLGLGAASRRADLEKGLRAIAELLNDRPLLASYVV